MIYLERNLAILEEIQNSVELVPGQLVGESYNVRFMSAGSYYSKVLGKEVWLGLKMSNYQVPFYLSGRAPAELIALNLIAENLPNRRADLPLFYGVVTNTNDPDEPVAILTEDFSKGGINDVWAHNKPPEDLVRLFTGEHHIDVDLDKACFDIVDNVGTEVLKMGDFYPADYSGDDVLRKQWLALMDKMEDEGKYSVMIDYSLTP